MKKLTLILALIPFVSFSQDTLKKNEPKKPEPKIKFQYIQVNMLKEQYDTVMFTLLKSSADMQTGLAGIRIFKDQAQVINVYDTVATLPKKDSVFVKPKNKKYKAQFQSK